MNDRARKLVAQIKAIEGEDDQFSHIYGLTRSDQSELQRVMSPEFKARYHRWVEIKSRKSDVEIREAQLEQARQGKAANESDMVEVLLENRDRLRPNDREWIEKIDATAAGLVGIAFTPRQSQVIREIYFRYYAGAS